MVFLNRSIFQTTGSLTTTCRFFCAQIELETDLEHDSTELNHAPELSFCLSMIFSENRFPLCANAALRVRIVP
jgi:hypothetical protein